MNLAFGRMLAISSNTFKEAVRNRAFIGLMLGALVLISASLVISEMVVFDQRKRVVQDFGLFFISFAGVVISVIIGVLLVFKELERKTIYSLLSKPVQRFEFILGRYAGMFMLLLSVTAVLTGAWVVVMLLRGVELQLAYLKATLLILGELSIVGAVAILFSSFSTPILSGIFTFGIFVLCRQVYYIEQLLLATKGVFVSAPGLRPIGEAVVRIFPDLSLFDVTREILLEVEVPWLYVVQSLGYAMTYVFIIITMAIFVFQRRDFV
jgi:Cu-processing system permease protein